MKRKAPARRTRQGSDAACAPSLPSLSALCFLLLSISFSFLRQQSINGTVRGRLSGRSVRHEERKHRRLLRDRPLRGVDGAGGSLCNAIQSRRRGIFLRRKQGSVVGRGPELL